MSKKILIIDDEADVLTYLTTVLRVNGFKPFSINSVVGALKEVRKIQPDLICLDIMMPRETGVSFYKELRQSAAFRNIPVIMISGAVATDLFNVQSFMTDKSIPAPECFMEKPIKVEEFIGTINKLVSRKK